MSPGRLLRDKARDDAAAKAGCANCRHLQIEHHELPREFHRYERGRVVTRPNPAFRPWQFHCDHPECGCVVSATA
jgi:hypothetical protein